jgi:tetratricopeptide (TPR) repeat protein
MKIINDIMITQKTQIQLLGLGLVILTITCFWPVKDFEFINFDDDLYVTENQVVRSGINKDSFIWAFNFEDKNKTYWHPLSWLSHMLDVQLYSLNSGQHHLTNLIFHSMNAILLFFVLHRMTGAIWRSAFVATLFAIHPVNVESVAWIAERKNLLSTFFYLLTLLAYAYYNEKRGIVRYQAVLFCFALGLLTKPMMVTLPFVLLLLDYFPLNRFKPLQPERGRWRILLLLILEKIPLVLLSGLAIGLTSTSLRGLGSYISLQSVPIPLRLGNAVVSYVKYIFKMVWPHNLAVLYPFPEEVPMYQALGALFFLGCLTILFITAYKKHSYLMIGWFWFLGTLVPVIGLVQAGLWPAMADRWAYVPMIGLFIIVGWGISDLLKKFCIKKSRAWFCIFLIVCSLLIAARKQIGYWNNGVSLFKRAVDVTENNYIAENNLGQALLLSGQFDEAVEHFNNALDINPKFATAHFNLGLAFAWKNKPRKALQAYASALAEKPDYAKAYNFSGKMHFRLGNDDQAIFNYQQAVKIKPDYAEAHNNLGNALFRLGEIDKAYDSLQRAIRISPTYADAYNSLGNFWYHTGNFAKALPNYKNAIKYNSNLAEAYNGTGAVWVRLGELRKAAIFFQEAVRIDPDYIAARNNLTKTLTARKNSKY